MAQKRATGSKDLRADAFARSVRSGEGSRCPVYAVVGDEAYLRRHAAQAVVQLARKNDGEPPARVVLEGDETDVPAFRRACSARCLGTHTTVLHLRCVDGRRSWLEHEKKREALLAYLDHPEPHIALVVEAKALRRNLKIAKRIVSVGAWIDCSPWNSSELRSWLLRQAKKRRIQLTSVLADFMLAHVGHNMDTLHSELLKLDLYLGEEGAPLEEDLREVLIYRGDAVTFDLLDRMCAGDTAGAVKLLLDLLRRGENPFALIGLIGWRLRQHWRAAGAIEAGASTATGAQRAGVPPFARASFLRAQRRLTTNVCRKLQDLLIQADRKVSPLKPEKRLELFLVQACAVISGNNS